MLGLSTLLGSAQTLSPGPQVLTFFSDIDDSEQPYCIYIPQDFDESRSYPLVVMLHGAGSNHRLAMRRVFGKSNLPGENDVEASLYFPPWKDVDMIVAAPYARGTAGYQGFVEKDVLDMIADVRHRFRIDSNRMYLTGLSMGGGGTLWIGLGHPDLWAAIAAVCPAPPKGNTVFAPNALNMAVRFVHGDKDPAVPVTVSRDWVAELQRLQTPHVEYEELPGVDHWSWVQAYEDAGIFEWFAQFERDPFPRHVRHACADLAHGKAYWVRIDQKTPGVPSLVDAIFAGNNALTVQTSEVLAFTLSLAGHPMMKVGDVLRIRVDDTTFVVSEKGHLSFVRKGPSGSWKMGRYAPEGLYKNTQLDGPLYNAFSRRHVYVYGTADDPSESVLRARIDTALKAADWSAYRDEFLGRVRMYPRVVADRDVRPSDDTTANLILFGTEETNSVIRKYADRLPLHLKQKASRKYGLAYVFPNDLHRLVVISSGLPWWLVDNGAGWRYFPRVQSSLEKLQDYVLFSRDLKTVVQGSFDENWRLSEEQVDVLAKTRVVEVARRVN